MANSQKPTNGAKNELVALAYDPLTEEILATARPSKGIVDFDLDREALKNSKVVVLPKPPIDPKEIDIARLEKLVGLRPPVFPDLKNRLEIGPIPDSILDRWRWLRCCVSGTVSKDFNIDGQIENQPLCNAVVHICEVDPYWPFLQRIPDYELIRFREDLFREVPRIDLPQPEEVYSLDRPEIPRPIPVLRSLVDNIDLQLVSEIKRASPAELRQIIRKDYQILRPILCWYRPIWSYFLRCDEIATVTTDANGRFQACFPRQFGSDTPDLYFWIEMDIDGEMTTVYRPPLYCNTYWNHDCANEVDIRVTDDRVEPHCSRVLPGEIIWIKRIGSGTDIRSIAQDFGDAIPVAGTNMRTVGLSSFATGGLYAPLRNNPVRPFTGVLPLVVQFGSGFPTSNATHYRWSYRKTHTEKLLTATTADREWRPLDNRGMHKSYTVEVGSGSSLRFERRQFELGPFNVGGVQAYRIPPTSPKGPGVANDPTAEWNQDTVTYYIDTRSLRGDGLYEFKLEVFDNSGNRIDLIDQVYHMTSPTDRNQSAQVGSEYLLPSSLDPQESYRFRLRVDNQPCEASIGNIAVDGNEAGTDCGFVPYISRASSHALFSFRAQHPNGFATWSFNVTRGNTGNALTAPDDRGSVLGNSGKYTLGADGSFSNSTFPITVADLLQTCPEKAAFAESLYVAALHTNGSSIVRSLDRSANAAFALEPETSA